MNPIRQAIKTKYHGPTNFSGARIKATCDAFSKFFPWEYEFSVEMNHRRGAQLLMSEMGWDLPLNGGSFKDEYYWVQVES